MLCKEQVMAGKSIIKSFLLWKFFVFWLVLVCSAPIEENPEETETPLLFEESDFDEVNPLELIEIDQELSSMNYEDFDIVEIKFENSNQSNSTLVESWLEFISEIFRL